MFGDGSEDYIQEFERLLEDISLESFLEQEDLTPAEALYKLFLEGHVKNPFER